MEEYDIIGVTESWIDTTSRDFLAEFAIPGYNLFSSERPQRAGGGVLLYVKSCLKPHVISKHAIKNINAIYIQINQHARKIAVGLIYRPPVQTRDIDDQIYEQIAELCCQEDSIVFGDFNLPVHKWGQPLNSHSGHDLYKNLQESALYQHVEHPTRGDNILDIILTTDESLVSNVNVGTEFSTSDHRVITFNIQVSKTKERESKEKVLDYRRADFRKLRRILTNTDWSVLHENNDIDSAWQFFSTHLNRAVESCVPLRNRRTFQNIKPKWWNGEIKASLLAKKRAYEKYILTKTENDKLEHDRIRRSTKRLIKQSKRNFEVHVANNSKSNPKEFYSYIRKKKVLTSTIGPLVTDNGEHTEDEIIMADILNNFFASVFTIEDTSGNQPTPKNLNNDNHLNTCVFRESDVLLAINNLKTNKTPGPDKISPRILKEVKDEIANALTILFNKSLITGKVPDEWKLANVTPIFKKGNKSQPGNYRPISLTSVVGKLMESIIRDKTVEYLEKNAIIKDSQHGFRNKRSCLTNLLDFFNDVFKMYDNSKAVDVIYLDFQKAFDKVPHKRLISKVKAHGITGNLCKWMEDWLSNRKQRVVINGKSSEWINVHSGVPQGSVLGPILFIIYINDIDEGITCKISKYADDTKIANKVNSETQRQHIQKDLDTLMDWSKKWQMNFNLDKCHVLHVGNENPHANYTMNNVQLINVDREKDLGVIISKDLKPSEQCTEIVKIANKLVGFIGRTFTFKSEKVILTLYNSLVRPHLEYCVQFWSPYYRKDIEKLERIQRRVTKMIPRLRNKPYEERLKELNLFSLTKRRLRGDLITVFKIFRGFTNINPNDYFSTDESRITRSNGFKIIGKRFETNEAKYFFFNRIVNVWNGLPSNVVNSITIETFKTRLDNYLLSNPRLALYVSDQVLAF